jgi:hypothetical protein
MEIVSACKAAFLKTFVLDKSYAPLDNCKIHSPTQLRIGSAGKPKNNSHEKMGPQSVKVDS